MSIFEPIPRESQWDDGTPDFDEAPPDDDSAPPAGSLDPRSIRIAGLALIAIVVAGLVASNTADPESRARPSVSSRGDPGAAAVEQTEANGSAPTTGPSASPSAEQTDEADDGASNDSSDGYSSSGGTKWESKPGKGHGRGHG